MAQARIKQIGNKVLLAIDGKEVQLPCEAALSLAQALREQGKLAEEYERAENGQLITDHAILTRLGFPIGLSNHPKVQAEVAKEAAWNSDLRRYLPGGVRSEAVVGTPTMVPHSPTPAQQAANAAYWAKKGEGNG